MAKWNEMKHALVTGAAGLIGSHVVDLLVREGWQVRALDNLEPQTHRRGKPAWINSKAEFILGDMRNREAITAALDGINFDLSPSFVRRLHAGDREICARKFSWHGTDA